MQNTSTKPDGNGTEKKSKRNEEKANAGIAKGFRELFIDELQDIYWAEKALVKAIPKMIKNATADVLVNALKEHLVVTKVHVKRLENVFHTVGEKPETKKCRAMSGLIKEAKIIMDETETGIVRDAGIISAAQKIEHYEIATYGTLCSFAKTLGETGAAALLHETLDEEKEADDKLSEIAEYFINAEAAGTGEITERIIIIQDAAHKLIL